MLARQCLVVFGVHVRLTESLKNHRYRHLEPLGSRPAWLRHFWGLYLYSYTPPLLIDAKLCIIMQGYADLRRVTLIQIPKRSKRFGCLRVRPHSASYPLCRQLPILAKNFELN